MKITALSILLVVAFLLAPRALQAQSGTGGSSAVPSAVEAAPASTGAETNRLFARIGVVGAAYHSGATIATNGQVIPGATAKVSNNVAVTIDVGYDITRSISASLMVGVPPKPMITGEGAVGSLGELGRVRYGPAIFTGYYRFRSWRNIRAYAGAGAAYVIIFKEFDAAVSQLKVHNNWGFVLQAGAEYQLSRKLALFDDFKEVWVAVDAHGLLAGSVPVKARVKLNPSIVSAGIKFHFY